MSVDPAAPDGTRVPDGNDASQPEMNVALRVEYEMRHRGWSQERLSKEMADAGCPIHQSSISKIINPRGKRRTISVDEVVAFAKVFDTTLDDMLLPLEVAQSQEIHQLVETVSTTLWEKAEQVEIEMRAWTRLLDLLEDPDVARSYQAWLQEVKKMSKPEAKEALYSWERRAGHVMRYYTETLLHSQVETDRQLRQDLAGPHARLSVLVRARRAILALPEVTTAETMRDWIKTHVRYLVEGRMSDLAYRLLEHAKDGSIPDDVVQECFSEIKRQITQIAELVPLSSDDEFQRLGAQAAPLFWEHVPVQDIAARVGVTLEQLVQALRRGAILDEPEAEA